LYFLFFPTLTLTPSLSSFTNLVTLDAGGWDNVDLATVKTLANPTTGVLRTFVAPDSLTTISTDKQFGDDLNSGSSTKFTSFTARGLESITGDNVFYFAVIDTLNLPALTTIEGSHTFCFLNNPLLLPKLTTITGNTTFFCATTGEIDLPSLTTIKTNSTFQYFRAHTQVPTPILTLTLRTNLKISKTSSGAQYDNFYYCCSGSATTDTFLNLLYSTEEGTPGGKSMTGVILNLGSADPISTSTIYAGRWRMNAEGSQFLTKLKTITLRPAEGMTMPDEFTVEGALDSSGKKISISFKKSDASAGVEWDETSQTYTWTRP
jgi:hypothetical protein